jgi:stearoyl-CoA desaturase (Delta-9 desaturase)
MLYIAACLLVFAAAYTLNILMITVGYHRGLAHGAVTLGPRTRKFVIATGNWVTGLDPKAWSVMHRRHHAFSDTEKDPHSPVNVGIAGIATEQLRSYKRVIIGLIRKDPEYTAFTEGLDFKLSWLNRKNVWWLPYVLHAVIAIAIGLATGWVLLPLCYFAGMMSHPLQGGLVNAFGHAKGGRNFDTDDQSKNTQVVAWLVAGEGYQNNHHAYPASPKFSYAPTEFDSGYVACRVLEKTGMLEINRHLLLPAFPKTETAAAESGTAVVAGADFDASSATRTAA